MRCQIINREVLVIGKENRKKTGSPTQTAKQGNMKEEISLELAEIGNLTPKQEPMTPNQRKKSEAEKTY